LFKFFQREGRFSFFKNEVTSVVISFVATQVDVVPEIYLRYAWTGSTIEYIEHRSAKRLEAPISDHLTRIIRSGLHNFEQQLYDATLDRLPEASQVALEAHLQTEVAALEMSEDQGQGPPDPQATRIQTTSTLQVICQDSGRVGLATMLEEMAKLRRIWELGLPDDLFVGLARKVISVYRNRASVESPSRLRAHSKAQRLTLLSALCIMRAQEITDGLINLLIHIVHKIDVRAEKRVEQEYMNEYKLVANKESILCRITEAVGLLKQ
jgi:hypothetical protein